MPTPHTLNVPPPTDWAEFEDITRDALSIKWSSPSLQKNGRQGQPQAGVDIYGPDDLGRRVGVQCKLSESIDLKTVKEEITKAESFIPTLQSYYIVIGGPLDAVLQKEVRLLSESRNSTGKFTVGLIFWKDIYSELANRPDIYQKHFPALSHPAPKTAESSQNSKLLSAMDIAYYGRHIADYLQLMFGEIGLMSSQNPNEFAGLTHRIASTAHVLLGEPAKSRLINLSAQLLGEVLGVTSGKISDWNTADALAAEIAGIAHALENNLSGQELAAYNCGAVLGVWNFAATENRQISQGLVNDLIQSASVLKIPEDLKVYIEKLAADFKADESVSVVHIPFKIYARIRSHVRTLAMSS